MNRIKNIKRYSSAWWTYVFICILWGNFFFQFLRGFIMRIPVIGQYPDTVIDITIIIPLLGALPFFIKNLTRKDFIFVGVISFVYLLNYIIYPQNEIPLQEHAYSFLCLVLPWYLVGKLFNIEDYKRAFHIISVIVVLSTAYYYLFFFKGVSSNDVENYNMDASYKLLPHTLMTLWVSLKRPSILNVTFALVGLFMILSFGTRGPLVCCVCFILLYSLFFKEYKHAKIVKTFIVSACIIFYYFLDEIMLILLGVLVSFNMSTRILDKYFSDDLGVSEGRDYITDALWNVMHQDGNFLGHGICGSWAYIDIYPHHLIIDFWFTFGYAIGTVLLIALFTIIVKAIGKANSFQKEFILLLFCSTIVKLFMSGTYLDDALLFFLIGYGLRIIKINNKIEQYT